MKMSAIRRYCIYKIISQTEIDRISVLLSYVQKKKGKKRKRRCKRAANRKWKGGLREGVRKLGKRKDCIDIITALYMNV
jgi:hypothetical protein